MGQIAPFLRWIAKLDEMVAGAFQFFLDHCLELYDHTQKSIESFVRFFYRYHLTVRGKKIFDETLPRGIARVRVEFEGERAKLTLFSRPTRGGTETPHALGTYHFLTELRDAPPDEVLNPRGYLGTAMREKRYRRAMKEQLVRHFSLLEIDVPVEITELRKWQGLPPFLAEKAAVLNLTLTLLSLRESLARESIDTYLNLTEETLQLVDTSANLYRHIAKARGIPVDERSPFLRAAPKLAKFAGLLGALRDLYEGGTNLLYCPTSGLVQRLDRGETVAAQLELVKSVVQVGTGLAALAELGTAVMAGAGLAIAGPLAMGVAVGAVVVLSLDLAIYGATRGDSRIQEFLDEVEAAEKASSSWTNEASPPRRTPSHPVGGPCIVGELPCPGSPSSYSIPIFPRLRRPFRVYLRGGLIAGVIVGDPFRDVARHVLQPERASTCRVRSNIHGFVLASGVLGMPVRRRRRLVAPRVKPPVRTSRRELPLCLGR